MTYPRFGHIWYELRVFTAWPVITGRSDDPIGLNLLPREIDHLGASEPVGWQLARDRSTRYGRPDSCRCKRREAGGIALAVPRRAYEVRRHC